MILMVILVLQTAGTLFGAQILPDPDLKAILTGKKRNGIRLRKRSRFNEENKSDSRGNTDENVPEKWLVDAVRMLLSEILKASKIKRTVLIFIDKTYNHLFSFINNIAKKIH
jgi:ribosomal protein L13